MHGDAVRRRVRLDGHGRNDAAAAGRGMRGLPAAGAASAGPAGAGPGRMWGPGGVAEPLAGRVGLGRPGPGGLAPLPE